jgi:phosphomannomutase
VTVLPPGADGGPARISRVVKAYDVRGVVPDDWDEATARALGAAFVDVACPEASRPSRIVVARDMRPSGPALVAAFADGARHRGATVIDAGLASTDQLYFASGHLNAAAAMFTASHNPARYNGIKFCRPGAVAIGQDSGLAEIRDRAARYVADGIPAASTPGGAETADLLGDYAGFLRSLVDLSGIRPLTVVVDAGNGMAGLTVPAVLGDRVLPPLPVTVIPLYFELDGSFPNHEANPLDPANLVDLQKAVVSAGADLGLAFDGDADRCFVVDADGRAVSPSAITCLVAARELAKHPGATVIHNLITSRSVPEVIAENGGRAVRTRVGHSFIKAEMARTGAVFGGEHSAHYYFRDFWFADTGMLAALHVLAALGRSRGPLAELIAPYDRYRASGEINSTVRSQEDRMAAVRDRYAAAGQVDLMDGLTLAFPDGSWINVRPSNTEPLLRLNVEAPNEERMEHLRDEVLAVIREQAAP